MIDFSSPETHLLLNPRMPDDERRRLEQLHASVPALAGHIWLATSGTTGSIKLVALSKPAMLASAAAVNAHLDAAREDVWCCVLPRFHVGGLSIYARAFTAGATVRTEDWEPRRFARGGFTLASLVPAQVRDLVQAALPSPPGVRAVAVGGGAMSRELYRSARDLGWPILPSYGLTEAASQVATATVESEALRILRHVEVREIDGALALRGPSLLTGYAMFDDRGQPLFADPKRDGWFVTEDRGEVVGGVLRIQGRAGAFIKIGGESVDLLRLDGVLESVRGEVDAALVALPDERLGFVIHLAAAAADAGEIVERFNARVLPFERIRAVHRVEAIPRTALGKVRRAELTERLR
ncbi:MAG TPA: AMP-binding protein [Thermoanaerobaculia bacterium]|nr:AMP-binding protein [Thermoanaerobaculia bacterium]